MAFEYYLKEDGSGYYQTEDGSGEYQTEASSTTVALTVTPGVGAIAVAGLAASLIEKASTVTPGVGLATVGGLSPSALDDKQVGPTTGMATLQGLAPALDKSLTVTPGLGAVSFAGLAPTAFAQVTATVSPGVGLIFGARAISWTADSTEITADSDIATADGFAIDLDFHPTILILTPGLVGRRGRTRQYWTEVHTTPVTAPYVPEPWTNPPELRLPKEVAELHAALDREHAQAATVAVLAKAKRRAQNRRALEMLLMDE